jgi:hypothetical protein
MTTTDAPVWVVRLSQDPADPDRPPQEGGELVLLANVADQFLQDEPRWASVSITKHAGAAAVPPLVADDDRTTIAVRGRPLPVPPVPDPPSWDDVPHPPTVEDPSVLVIHLIRFEDGGADNDMVSYQNAAGQVAVPHGVRLDGWFGIDDTLLGDGRTWDQVRFNAFPSRAAFLAVVFDPARLEAHKDHREVAIADTYTMILRPLVDTLLASHS